MEDGSPRRLMQQDLANIKNEVLADVSHFEETQNIFAQNKECVMV